MSITANKLVSDIRNIASSGSNPIEFKIEDSQVLFWCSEIRAKLIWQQIQKYKEINKIWLQSLTCLALVQVDKSECCEIETNCPILRTELPIPEYLEIIRIETPKGDIIPRTTPIEEKYNKYNKYTKDTIRWFVKGRYVYVVNQDFLSTLGPIWGIWEDPAELVNYTSCDGSTCFGWDDSYPVDVEMAGNITDIVLRTKVYPYLQLPADNVNDANNTTSQPNIKNI